MSSVTGELDRTFAALADPHRRDILERVSHGPVSASELAAPLGMTVTGVLKHVHVLEDARFITTRKVGRTRWCQLAPSDPLGTAAKWISSRRHVWERRLDRFEAHLDQQSRTTP
jgi:DNA-binding transcriptional ArsR family regulator